MTISVNTPHSLEEVERRYTTIGTDSVFKLKVVEAERMISGAVALYDRADVKGINVFEIRDENEVRPRVALDA